MTIDRRLHHAARELREIEIDAPPLPKVSAGHVRRSKIPAVAASLLVVLGGIAVWSGMSDVPAGQSEAELSRATEVTVAPALVSSISPREELALIASLTSKARQSFLQPPAGAI
jgi:hypothetical protein